MTISSQLKELIRYATLAANGHNTQPWRFSINQHVVKIIPDFSRMLKNVDPHNRALWISLGCALENFSVAARATGYEVEIIYPEKDEWITIQLISAKPQNQTLLRTIEWRQCTRSMYNGLPIGIKDLDTLSSIKSEPGVALHFFTDGVEFENTLEYLHHGTVLQYKDKEFINELVGWLRFNKREATSSMDGLFTPCSGNPEIPRWLGQLFVRTINPQKQADGDVRKLRSSSGAVVIASEGDDRISWVHIGQVCERLALTMTSLEIRSTFLNQPIEVDSLREQYGKAIGLGSSYPQLMMRFGYAPLMPYSIRRPLHQVLA